MIILDRNSDIASNIAFGKLAALQIAMMKSIKSIYYKALA